MNRSIRRKCTILRTRRSLQRVPFKHHQRIAIFVCAACLYPAMTSRVKGGSSRLSSLLWRKVSTQAYDQREFSFHPQVRSDGPLEAPPSEIPPPDTLPSDLEVRRVELKTVIEFQSQQAPPLIAGKIQALENAHWAVSWMVHHSI